MSIYIKKKNRGKFGASASRAGMGTQEYARHILANKEDYSPIQVKRAAFAKGIGGSQIKKHKHENGGILKAQEGVAISSERIPTLEEYIQMKQQEARQMAIANSYNATEPRLAKRYYSDDYIKNLEWRIWHAKDLMDYWNEESYINENMLRQPGTPSHTFVPNLKYMINGQTTSRLADKLFDRYEYTQNEASDCKQHIDYLESMKKVGYDWTGDNCLTNATGWYGDPYICASNIEFAKNPKKFGYVEINVEDALPGDIFQYTRDDGIPYHATLYSKKGDHGEFFSNYSNGGYEESIKKDSSWFGQGNRAYRFVGLPEDIEAWTQEYNESYGKKFGGVLDKFKNGGILKAQEGTGNLYAPHPLSPVGIALNQAKAMAKGKKDQQHLPPGVKEVVGPDGKKVAIRTEQPLQPLEQSIAEWLPGTGDVAEVGYIANDVKNGNLGSAALAAAMIALPGNVGKLLSKHRKAVSKTADAVEDAVRKADVSEYINTVDDALPERQPLTTNKSKQFWDGTSESKLTDAEKEGVPKGERNQPINVRTPSQEFSNKYISSKMSLRKPTYDYEDLTENYFRDVSADEFNKRLKEYVSYARHKGSPITNEIAEPIVKGYRNYLHHLDFDAKDLSDDELRIILSKHFADLSRGASGKMKDQIVWHSSPTWFDEFDYRYTGKNMENSGAMGPGNYFSKEATMYGRGKKGEFSGKYDMGNTQPYIITDVISTPSGKDMQNKGLLPTIIHKYRGRDIYGQKWNPDPEFDIKLKAQIDAVPLNDNKMYVLEGTDSGFDKLYQTPFGLPGGELMIRRNTGIKSLYPHPSRFVRDADGFVHLIPVDWNDARVNFKKGGKL